MYADICIHMYALLFLSAFTFSIYYYYFHAYYRVEYITVK
jgi:hypothetical protein